MRAKVTSLTAEGVSVTRDKLVEVLAQGYEVALGAPLERAP